MSEEKPQETYYKRHLEKCRAKAKEYRDSHKEDYQTYWKQYYQENKDKLRVKHREYRRKNRDRLNRLHRTVYYPRHEAKKKNEIVNPIPEQPVVLSPEVELPPYVMIISRGDHTITFD